MDAFSPSVAARSTPLLDPITFRTALQSNRGSSLAITILFSPLRPVDANFPLALAFLMTVFAFPAPSMTVVGFFMAMFSAFPAIPTVFVGGEPGPEYNLAISIPVLTIKPTADIDGRFSVIDWNRDTDSEYCRCVLLGHLAGADISDCRVPSCCSISSTRAFEARTCVTSCKRHRERVFYQNELPGPSTRHDWLRCIENCLPSQINCNYQDITTIRLII